MQISTLPHPSHPFNTRDSTQRSCRTAYEADDKSPLHKYGCGGAYRDELMPPIPCQPLPNRRRTNWQAFYERELPDVLYRVHTPSLSHTSYTNDRGFVPSAGVTRRVFDRLALHNAAVGHCLGWFVQSPSPFVSLTCSFGYAVWEAHRRYAWKRSLKDITICVVDCRALLRRRPAEKYLFHAVELIDGFGPCKPSGCARGCERAARYANIADELLVFGSVPRDTIIGSISFEDLLVRLPEYFFIPHYTQLIPSQRDTTHLLEGFSRNSYRDAYTALERNISTSVTEMSLASHAEAALDIGIAACSNNRVCVTRHLAYHVRIVATDVVNWIISWADMGGEAQDHSVKHIDPAWYVNEYIAFRSILCVWEEEEDFESPEESERQVLPLVNSTVGGIYLQDTMVDPEHEAPGVRDISAQTRIGSTSSAPSLGMGDLNTDWDGVIEQFGAHMRLLGDAEPRS